jgi:hypothetical protein
MVGTHAPPFTTLRELVLHYATRQGLNTQRRLAIACDLDETAVSRFLNGEQDIGAWTTYCLFQAAGVPVEQYHRAFALLGEAQELARSAREARTRRRVKLVQQTRVAMVLVALALGVGGVVWVARLQLRDPASSRQTTDIRTPPPAPRETASVSPSLVPPPTEQPAPEPMPEPTLEPVVVPPPATVGAPTPAPTAARTAAPTAPRPASTPAMAASLIQDIQVVVLWTEPEVTPTPIPTAAGGGPTPPSRFLGTVSGPGVTDGATVTASVGTTVCGTGQVSGGNYVVDVAHAFTRPGCGRDGAQVTFAVGANRATQTGTFQSAAFTQLNLTVQPPTPTPAATTPRPTTPRPVATTTRTATPAGTPVRTATPAATVAGLPQAGLNDPVVTSMEVCFNLSLGTMPQPITVVVTFGSEPAASVDDNGGLVAGRSQTELRTSGPQCAAIALQLAGLYPGNEYTIAIFEGAALIASTSFFANSP